MSIKEKSTETAATVNGANHINQLQDTTNHTKKQPLEVSEYLEYCAQAGKQPNQIAIEFMDLHFEPPQYIGKTEEEQEIELIKNVEKLSHSDRAAMLEVIAFMIWKNQHVGG